MGADEKDIVAFAKFLNFPCHVFVKDVDGYYKFCNKAMAKDLGLANTEDIIGRHDKELIWKSFSSRLRENDKCVENIGEGIDFIEPVKLWSGKQVELISYKYPLLNGEADQGVFGISFVKLACCSSSDLSNRERQCIILTARGFSSKEIAKILNISFRTVEEYLEHAKNRLKCRNKAHLVSTYIKQTIVLPNLEAFKDIIG